MKSIFIVLCGLVATLFISGCSFGTMIIVTTTPIPAEIVVETATSVPQVIASSTPIAEATRVSALPTSTVPTQVPTLRPTLCASRTDWQVYTVVAGDTLGNIANRTGATIAQLADANCLVNANYISVGQRLFVPRLPVIPTVTNIPNPDPRPLVYASDGQPLYDQCAVLMRPDRTPETTPLYGTANANEQNFAFLGNWGLWVSTTNGFHQITILTGGQGINAFVRESDTVLSGTSCNQSSNETVTLGDIQVSPHLASASRTFDLLAGDSVTLTWTNAPGGLADANFYLIETDGSRTLLGRDDYGADGWTVSWTVRLAMNGQYVIAEGSGFNSAPFTTAMSFPVTLFSNWDVNQVCVAQNIAPLPIYEMPGTDSPIVGELPANTQWLALAFATDNWLAVRGGGGWISASLQVNTSGNCNP